MACVLCAGTWFKISPIGRNDRLSCRTDRLNGRYDRLSDGMTDKECAQNNFDNLAVKLGDNVIRLYAMVRRVVLGLTRLRYYLS